MKKCVHTIVINNWFPELCALTIPLIKSWANNIGADFNLISQAKFAGYPPNYEKIQIWKVGRGYDWNIYLDADIIVNPAKLPDFTLQDPRFFYFEAQLTSLGQCFGSHPYFIRDDRNFGVSDCFLAASNYFHDLWHPLDLNLAEAKKYCKLNERMISELAINLNIARFGLRGFGTIGADQNHFHLQTSDDFNRPFNGGKAKMTKAEHVARARQTIKRLGIKI